MARDALVVLQNENFFRLKCRLLFLPLGTGWKDEIESGLKDKADEHIDVYFEFDRFFEVSPFQRKGTNKIRTSVIGCYGRISSRNWQNTHKLLLKLRRIFSTGVAWRTDVSAEVSCINDMQLGSCGK